MFDASRSIRWEPIILAIGSMVALFLTGVMLALLPGQADKETSVNELYLNDYSVLEPEPNRTIVSYSATDDAPKAQAKPVSPYIKSLAKKLASSDDGSLPTVLSEHDYETYDALFQDVQTGNWQAVSEGISQLTNPLLVGHIKAEQYLHDHYISQFDELSNWMKLYHDHPQAHRIARLAERKRSTKAFRHLIPPKQRYLHGYGDSNGLSSRPENYYSQLLNFKGRGTAKRAWRQFTSYLSRGMVTRGRDYIHSPRMIKRFKQAELDLARYAVAHAYVAYNKNEEGYAQATLALKSSESRIPRLHWVAGLASWRMGNIEKAAQHFSRHTTLEKDPWVQSASAFWAYRAFIKLNNKAQALEHLKVAAQSPRTFYGMLAQARLGKQLNVQSAPAEFSVSRAEELLSNSAVQRMLALHELGQDVLVEREMRATFPQLSNRMAESLIMLSSRMNQPAVQLRMSRDLLARNPKWLSMGKTLDYGRFPMPNWEPAGGFRLDPAFLYALAHLESGFNPQARSYKGALGVMQMLPSTAKYVASKHSSTMPLAEALADPVENLALGQNYVHYLAGKPHITHNLFFLAAAYNAGPGNVSKWQEEHIVEGDPLLFIETIPSSETRNYIEQLLTYYWVYRELMGLGNPTLYKILRDQWPIAEKFRWEEYAHALP